MTFLDDAAQRGKDLFEGVGVNRACTACHANAGANVVDDENPDEGFNDSFDTGTRGLRAVGPADGGFGQDHQDGVAGFGNGTTNTPPLIEAADTAPFFHNNSAATLEELDQVLCRAHFCQVTGQRRAWRVRSRRRRDCRHRRFPPSAECARECAQRVCRRGRRQAGAHSEQLQAIAAEIADGIEVLKASKLAPDAVAAFEDAAGLVADAATRPAALGEAQGILRRIPSLIAVKNETVAGN